jgi:hypothetical protein
MNRNYLPLWLLLALALGIFICLSAFSPIDVGPYQLKDSGIVSQLTAPQNEPPQPADSVFSNLVEQATPAPKKQYAQVDTTKKTILFIGDSMLEGLSPRLAAYCAQNGHKLHSVIWYSSTSEIWGRSNKLQSYIARIKPDYIFICLGANELFVKDIITKRDVYVKNIINAIGDIPYLWIGPPNWKPDTGINKLVATNAAPGSFFLSDGMTFERTKDGAHPTRSSACEWMDSVVRWMPTHSPHPIRLDKPAANTARPTHLYVHQPSER